MRAALIQEYGEPPVLGETEAPEAGDGQVLLDVEVAGVNPVDLSIASGKFDAGAPPLPYVAGREGIGTTAEGRRLWFDSALFPHGSIAERTAIGRGHGIEVPPEVAPEQAVAFGIAGLAAWLSLGWRGRLEEGETVLVLGASGVVGQIAVQAARLLGAGRVVGAARSASGRARVEELGVDAVVGTESEGDLSAVYREATEGGADLVIDALWGEPARAALGAMKPFGRLVQVGNSADSEAEITAGPLRGGIVSILGHRNFAAPAEEKARAFVTMCEHAAAGELEIDVEVLPMDSAPEAWRRQAESPGRKLALRIG